MDRRKSIKTIAVGTLSAGILLDAGCKQPENKVADAKPANGAIPGSPAEGPAREPQEKERYEKLVGEKFFNEHEMATIAVLADIIIPKDDVSGSATEAKVPDFIEFIVKDQPYHQVPVRGGLRWLDLQSMTRFEKAFKDCTAEQQIQLVDDIAYPERAKPEMSQGVAFFNHMRDLTASGFYSSEMGIKDIGYAGNQPNQWNGVPDDVLKQYGVAYTEKELKECVTFT